MFSVQSAVEVLERARFICFSTSSHVIYSLPFALLLTNKDFWCWNCCVRIKINRIRCFSFTFELCFRTERFYLKIRTEKPDAAADRGIFLGLVQLRI